MYRLWKCYWLPGQGQNWRGISLTLVKIIVKLWDMHVPVACFSFFLFYLFFYFSSSTSFSERTRDVSWVSNHSPLGLLSLLISFFPLIRITIYFVPSIDIFLGACLFFWFFHFSCVLRHSLRIRIDIKILSTRPVQLIKSNELHEILSVIDNYYQWKFFCDDYCTTTKLYSRLILLILIDFVLSI